MTAKYSKILSLFTVALLAGHVFANPCPIVFYLTLDQQTLTPKQKKTVNETFDQNIATYRSQIQSVNARGKLALDNKPAEAQLKLKLMSFNTGLLNRLFGLAYVPEYETRAREVPALFDLYLRQQKPSFVTLQEVWDLKDADYLTRIARANGYTSLIAARSGGANPFGLQTFVRQELLDKNATVETPGVIPMPQQLVEKAAGLQKGIFPIGATLKNGKRVLVVNAHFAYSPGKTASRLQQVQILSEFIRTWSKRFDYVFIGTDTNSSDRFEPNFDAVGSGWFKDKGVYLAIVEALGIINLRDTFASIPTSDPGYTQDPGKNDLTRFSATTKTEPAQRLDYIFVGSKFHNSTNYAVDQARIIFNEPLRSPDGAPLPSQENAKHHTNIFPSDHFGIETTIRIAN